ncbi:MAG TPA: hypothetical protein VMV19_16270 [Xanthobacteraceae bacterium]|nr:hypothetical protein [Xanthobacteraceae bacterium]
MNGPIALEGGSAQVAILFSGGAPQHFLFSQDILVVGSVGQVSNNRTAVAFVGFVHQIAQRLFTRRQERKLRREILATISGIVAGVDEERADILVRRTSEDDEHGECGGGASNRLAASAAAFN